jgi:hypothetical protein
MNNSIIKNMSKMKMLKQLEYLVAFQVECLKMGEWDDFDKAEGKIKDLEKKIISID